MLRLPVTPWSLGLYNVVSGSVSAPKIHVTVFGSRVVWSLPVTDRTTDARESVI
jgi:hypothetical protein